MDSSLKFDQESDIDNSEKRTPYRLCYKDRIKVITTQPVNADKIINTSLSEPERLASREVLRLTKVNSVDIIQTKTIHDGNSIKNRSATSVERQTTPSLYLPYILGNKGADTAPVFNKATYRSFRTQEERKCLAFSRSLERDQKQPELFNGKDKRLAAAAVLDISKPAQLHSRFPIMQLRSAR